MTSTNVVPAGARAERTGFAPNPYGYFTPDGREFRITDWRTPRPWANIIANPRFGLAVSQTGSGFTWVDNSQLAVLTRWQQDLTADCSGKFLYVRDTESGAVWSLSPAPTWPRYDTFECRHGLGYTQFVTELGGIRATWTLFAHATDTVEQWRVELENRTERPRRLELTAYLEWNCGVLPSPRREFHKLFLENAFDAERRAIFAWNHMWEVPSARFGHWNTSFPYVTALGCTEPALWAQGEKGAFTGRYGDLRNPQALSDDSWQPEFGRHGDAIAALRSAVELRRGERRTVGFALAVGSSQETATDLLDRSLDAARMDAELSRVQNQWRELLATQRIETPDVSVDALTNDWTRYQTISGRLWGRCGYYQQSGAFGFRDQLQDSQVWLTIDPLRCREQVRLHAAHQFTDGSVYHWWHPLTEQGHVTKMTDDLLWLAFVTANYIRETGDLTILADEAPYLDDARPTPLVDHVERAFARVAQRTSSRGLPFIGAGDWNDGLSAVGLQERGESIWLGQFLAGLLADWAEIYRRIGEPGTFTGGAAQAQQLAPSVPRERALQRAAELHHQRAALLAALNHHGWDGEWYYRATLDDGSKLGSAENRVGRIFLNAQTWAILNDIASPDRARQCWDAVCKHLVTDAGALLLAPAFDQPVSAIGYITRYAPGLRENGGVYTHAATWAIAAAAKMRDHEQVARLLQAINPMRKDPERYWAEPYVLPGNVDGPQSPHHGRAGWTWYTGSAQWLHRIVTQWVLGVRPEWDGLRFDPVLPADWAEASMTRIWRGSTLHIRIERAAGLAAGQVEVTVDGTRLAGAVLSPLPAGGTHVVQVRIG